MADTLAACEHGIHKLLGCQSVAIASPADFKPFHGVPCRVLQAQDVHVSKLLVSSQYRRNVVWAVAHFLKLSGKFNGVFKGELGTRPNGEMCCMNRIAHQHDMTMAIVQRPLLAFDLLEVKPSRPPQMTRIGHQPVTSEVTGKQFFAKINGLSLISMLQAVRLPHRFWAFDDKGCGLVIKLVDVRLKPTVFCFFKNEIKGIK